jgi:hypothetical protein
MKVHSAVVSQVVPVGFDDLVQAIGELPGHELAEDRTRLKLYGRVGTGLAGAIRFAATLQTFALLPPVKVEVTVSPWSADRSEVAIHPITNLGRLDSLRANRFYKAALAILPVIVDRLNAELSAEAPTPLELAA